MPQTTKIPRGYEPVAPSPSNLLDTMGIECFDSFEQADDFLEHTCEKCATAKGCEMYKGLRIGMAENCPIWFKPFMKLDRVYNYRTKRPERIVYCTEFERRYVRPRAVTP